MASVQNAQNPRFNVHRRSQPSGSIQKSKPRRFMYADLPLSQEKKRQSLPANLSENSILPQNTKNPNSQSSKQGRKRRVSESTPGWHPIAKKKRPKSDGDASTSKALRFSPYAGSAQPSPKSEERSLKRVKLIVILFKLKYRVHLFRTNAMYCQNQQHEYQLIVITYILAKRRCLGRLPCH